jgi:tRNA 2-thiocytidine biosynthesis protein TtcA
MVNKKLRERDAFSYHLAKKVARTIKKYGMIQPGDRVLAGVSGGKDSLTMLQLLHQRMGIFPNDYQLVAVHVASDLPCEGLIDPRVLERHFESLGCGYRIISAHIPPDPRGGSYWCSRNRRRVLFDTASRMGCNKIALGHHRNDVIETVLLNMFYHGELSAMLPRQELFEGRMAIIRPLYAMPERDTARYARDHGFPAVRCRCPGEGETRREMFKRLIGEIERAHPKGMLNALRSLENVNLEYLPGRVVEEDLRV